MKNETKAKELMADPNCANCGRELTGDNIVILFQDDQNHDLKDGYFCEKCASEYDEDGNILNQNQKRQPGHTGEGERMKAEEIIKAAEVNAKKNSTNKTYYAYLSGVLMNEIRKLCKDK